MLAGGIVVGFLVIVGIFYAISVFCPDFERKLKNGFPSAVKMIFGKPPIHIKRR